jgi:hypothetical protein
LIFLNSNGKCNLRISLIDFKIVKRISYFKKYPDDRKVKLVSLKLKKYAFLWWENLKKQRACEGRRRLSLRRG